MTMQIRTLLLAPAVLSGLLLGPASSTFAAAFSANPAIDAFVAAGPGGNLANNNYGAAGSLSLAAPGLPQGELQSVLQFNLASALSGFNTQFGAGQWSIQSVAFQATATSANNPLFNGAAAGTFGISWMQNDSWQEGTGSPGSPAAAGITFTTLQNAFLSANDESLGTFSWSGATSGTTVYTLPLSPGFISDLASGGTVSLRLFAADSRVSAVFNSRNFGTVANRPLLTVVAVPEPRAAAFIVAGLILLAGYRFCGCATMGRGSVGVEVTRL